MKKILSFLLLVAVLACFGMPKATARPVQPGDTLAVFNAQYMLNYRQHTVPFNKVVKPILVLSDTVLTEESFDAIQYKLNDDATWKSATVNPEPIP